MRVVFSCLILGGLALLVGCDQGGNSGSKGSGTSETKEEAVSAKKIDSSKLPKLGDYLPPLQGGTIELAGPDGWSILPKSNDPKMVAWFYHKDKTQLPRMEIKVVENPFTNISDVTAENLGEFSKKLGQQVAATRTSKEIIERCVPLILGGEPWVRYVRVAKKPNGDLVQIQALQTIRNDKLYSVELLIQGTEPEEMKKFKDFGYAVAAGMKFTAK